jgi:hypothetical protein
LNKLHDCTKVWCVQHKILIIDSSNLTKYNTLVIYVGVFVNLDTSWTCGCHLPWNNCARWWKIHMTEHQYFDWMINALWHVMDSTIFVWQLCDEALRQLEISTFRLPFPTKIWLLVMITTKMSMRWRIAWLKVHFGQEQKEGKRQ